MGELAIMGRQGDLPVAWDKTKPEQVETARRMFKDLRAKGYLAFTVNKEQARDQQITEFDPEAEKIILSPPLAGG